MGRRPFVTPGQCYPHKALFTMDFLHNDGIMNITNWPALSPDLNVIENMWKMVGDRVEGQSFENSYRLW